MKNLLVGEKAMKANVETVYDSVVTHFGDSALSCSSRLSQPHPHQACCHANVMKLT
jgi:hypothetical protein